MANGIHAKKKQLMIFKNIFFNSMDSSIFDKTIKNLGKRADENKTTFSCLFSVHTIIMQLLITNTDCLPYKICTENTYKYLWKDKNVLIYLHTKNILNIMIPQMK